MENLSCRYLIGDSRKRLENKEQRALRPLFFYFRDSAIF